MNTICIKHLRFSTGKSYAKILLAFFFLFIISNAFSQTIIWTDTLVDNNDQQALASCIDVNGNPIVAGQFQGTISINTTTGPVSLSSDGANNDGLILKYNTNGKVIWYAKIGGVLGANDDEVLGVTSDALGNVYVCGYTKSTTAIFYGNGNPDITRLNNGSEDSFIAKYDINGDLLWVNTPIATGSDRANDIVTDGTNVYVVGQFSGLLDFGAGALSVLNNIPGSSLDAFIASFTTNGVFNWTNRITGNNDQVVLAIDEYSSQIYVTGYFGNNNSTFNGSPNIAMNNINNDDIFTANYNKSNGNVIWVSKAGAGGEDRGKDIIANANGIYTVGHFTTTLDIYSPAQAVINTRTSNGNIDGFIIHYDFSGNYLNALNIGGTTNDFCNGIASDFNDDIFVIGEFANTVNFGSGNYTATGTSDVYFTSYDVNLNFNSATILASNATDNGTTISCENQNGIIGGYYDGASFTIPTSPLTPANPWINGDELFIGYFTSCPAPTITCPSNLTLIAEPGACTTAVTGIAPIDTSGCISNITYSLSGATTGSGVNDASGLFFNIGITTVTYTITDVNSNSSSCSFTVTVNDVENPVINCPASTIIESANPSCSFTIPDYTLSYTAADNCSLVSYTQSPIAGAIVGTGITNITLTATDGSGNSTVCNFSIDVQINLNQTPVTCGNVFIGETTFGGNDTQNSFNCLGYSTPGEDMFYEVVVPSTNYLIAVTITNFSDVNDTDLDFLFLGSGCSGSSCLEALTFNQTTQTFSNGNNSATFLATGPGTYYFVVDGQTDGIESYDISFTCVESGITFDNSGVCTGDTDNDGVISYLNGSTAALQVEPCEHVTVCHDLYIANLYDWEWLDSVHMDLGSCYTNISNASITPGFYQGGDWVPIIDVPGNAVLWEFNHNPPSTNFGDGYQGAYACANGETHLYSFCFEADISSTCSNNNDLNISIYVSDDGISGSGIVIGSFDVALANDFTVADSPPSFTSCPSNIIQNNIASSCSANVSWTTPLANDNCSVTVTQIDGLVSGSVFPVGVDTIVYVATDNFGQTDTCRFTITVIDNENPIINCPANVLQSTNLNQCTAIVNNIAPVSFNDNCIVNSITYTITGATTSSGNNDASGTVFNLGTSTVTYTVTDVSGNISSCNFTVTITDNQSPLITCPSNVTQNNNATTCSTVVTGIAPLIASDNCTVSSIAYSISGATTSSGISDASGESFNVGVSTVSYSIFDAAGNSSSCSFNVTITDNQAPTITCPVNVTQNNDAGSCSAIVNGISPITNDNCSVTSITYNITGATTTSGVGDASGTSFNVGTSNVTYTVQDAAGNSNSCSFNVTIVDIQPPTINCRNNINTSATPGLCSRVINNTALTINNDNCGIASTTWVITGATTGSGINNANGTSFNVGLSTVTYTVTDIHGNVSTCSFTVNISDNQFPVISCPSNVTMFNDLNQCGAIVNNIGLVSATDNCSIASITYTISGATIGSGINDASGEFFNVGISTVTYSVTDPSGRTSTCAFTVTIIDNQIPVISCVTDVNQNTSSGLCSAIINGIAPTSSSDNCSGSIITYEITGATISSGFNDASGTSFNLGVSTVTYTITGVSNNSFACSFTVTINDTEAPQLSCPTNQTLSNDIGFCGAVVNGIAPIYSDNCSIASVNYTLSGATTGTGSNDASGTFFNLGITNVMYSVTDAAGNNSSCSFSVLVNDSENPTINCPVSLTVNNDIGSCSAIVNGLSPIPNDNCTVASVTFSLTGATIGSGSNDASGSIFNLGTTIVSYNVTDAAGNSSSCNFNVTVVDNENPVINCPSNVTIGNDIGFCSAVVNNIHPVSSSDNCSVSSITYDLTGATTGSGINNASGNTFNLGVTTVTYTITDATGNNSTCSFTVTVNDTEFPTLSCPSNLNVNNDSGLCSAVVNGIDLISVNDNCSISSVIYNLSGATTGTGSNSASGANFNLGNTTVDYTVIDASGNSASCNFTVSVIDTEAPVIVCPNDTTVNNDIGFCTALVNDLAPINFSDNCSVNTINYSYSGVSTGNGLNDASGNIFDSGTSTITYTIIDDFTNSSSCSFDLTIIDIEKPSIVCTADIFSCDSLVTWSTPGANDNCGVNSVVQTIGNPPGSIFSIGTHLIEYVVTDNSGNTDTCSFNITIYPVTDSTWTAPADVCDNASLVNLDLLITGQPGGTFSGIGVSGNNFDPSIGAGTYSITYTTSLNGCIESMTNSITVLASPIANAGMDIDTCGLEADLSATSSNGIGIWSGNGITFNPSVNDTGVNILVPFYGTHEIYWTVDQSGVCSTSDTILVTAWQQPTADAGADQFLPYTEETFLDALIPSVGTGTWSGTNNSFANINDPGSLAQNLIVGENIIIWTVTNGTCPAAIDTLIIHIDDLTIPDVITPNNDGKNDFFVINGIEYIGPVSIEIFNRWGQIIYQNSDYTNNWDGMNTDGNPLPDDTYFYILTIRNNKTFQGYIVLKR